jgi:hypothetical protein
MKADAEPLGARIRDLVAEYYREAFAERDFVPGQTLVSVSGIDCMLEVLHGVPDLC